MKTWPSTGRTLPPWTRSGPGAVWTTSWSWEKRMRKSWRKTEQWIQGWAGCDVGIRAFLLSRAVFLLLTVPCCHLSLLPKREPSSPFQCAHSSNKGRSDLDISRQDYSRLLQHIYVTVHTLTYTCVFQLPSGDFIFWYRTVKILICTKAMLCINCYFFCMLIFNVLPSYMFWIFKGKITQNAVLSSAWNVFSVSSSSFLLLIFNRKDRLDKMFEVQRRWPVLLHSFNMFFKCFLAFIITRNVNRGYEYNILQIYIGIQNELIDILENNIRVTNVWSLWVI